MTSGISHLTPHPLSRLPLHSSHLCSVHSSATLIGAPTTRLHGSLIPTRLSPSPSLSLFLSLPIYIYIYISPVASSRHHCDLQQPWRVEVHTLAGVSQRTSIGGKVVSQSSKCCKWWRWANCGGAR